MDKKQKKRNEIIEKSIHVIYMTGYHGAGIQDLVNAAGIPKGSFYNYFNSKEDYAIQALHYFHQHLKENMLCILKDSSQPPKERVKRFFHANVARLEELHFQMGCLLGNMSQEMGDINEPIAHTVDAILKEIVGEIAECLERENTGLDCHAMAEFLVNSFQGAMLRMKSSRSRHPLDVFLLITNQLMDCKTEAE